MKYLLKLLVHTYYIVLGSWNYQYYKFNRWTWWLSSSVAMISSLSFAIVAGKFGYTNVIIMSSILAGACLGFYHLILILLKYLWEILVALFLGFMLAAISIEGVMKSVATIAVIVPIMILGVPIFDTTFAICRRILNGKSITTADKGHLHHRLLAKGYSQRKTVMILYGISAVFVLFAVIIAKANSNQAVYLSVILFVVTVIVGLKLGSLELKKEVIFWK